MASGSSGRVNTTSQGFDFGSDDVLCTYDDFNGQDGVNGSNGTGADSVVASNSNKPDFNKSRMIRSSYAPSPTFKLPEETLSQEIVNAIEGSMKKNCDNIMRFLEGISSRLSQLELYCYNVDKSVGEMRSELVRGHEEVDSKLKTLEKHIEEVHRSVQILRDKQELSDNQKELAKLQLAQKESARSSQSQQNEERPLTPAVESQKVAVSSDVHNQQLALALPHQIPTSQSSLSPTTVEPSRPVAHPPHAQPQNVPPQQHYYLPQTENQALRQPSTQGQGQYGMPDSQYRQSQLQDMSQVHPQPVQPNLNRPPPPSQAHHFPQYQQQWPQQLTQQQLQLSLQPPIQQQPPNPTHIRTQPGLGYPSYQASQPASPARDSIPSSMQLQFSGIPQSGMSRTEAGLYGYERRPIHQQPPTQQLKSNFGAQANDGYTNAAPDSGPALPSGYMMYGNEGGPHPTPQQPHFSQGVYPSNPQNVMAHNPNQSQFGRNHPYNDLVEKLVNMGFRGDHVLHVIQLMEDNGQPIDFNAVLDRLSVQSSGGSYRGWSA